MASTIKSINEKLYGMLHSNGFDPTPIDASGDDAVLPEEADLFQVVTKNGSPVTIIVTTDRILQVRYSSDATKDDGWNAPDGLMSKLRGFRREHNLMGFEPEQQSNTNKLKYDMAKRVKTKREELAINEGYHSMGKRASYNDSIPSVKIVIQHNRQIGEGEQRFRNVEKIFIENVDGERYRSPTNSPGLTKVFARLVAEGYKPHGEHWNHLVSLVEDYTKLSGFVRATRNGVFKEEAQRWIEAGLNRYSELRETLRSLTTSRGHRVYFESWTPTLNESADEGTVDLSEMFKSNVLDRRVEAALPVIKRLSAGVVHESNLASPLEEWAGQVERDAVYGIEDRAEGKLNEGCDCGPDCDCPDCEEHNTKPSSVKKKFSVRENNLNLQQIEKTFGELHTGGNFWSKNSLIYKHLLEVYGTKNYAAESAMSHLIESKQRKESGLPLTEAIDPNDLHLNHIFDSFNQFVNLNKYRAGDKVIVFELIAMPFGNTKQIHLDGSYKPFTIEKITSNYIYFTNGQQKPSKRVTQVALWSQVALFDTEEEAEKCATWMSLKSGEWGKWKLQINVDQTNQYDLEETSYGGFDKRSAYSSDVTNKYRISRGSFVKTRDGKVYKVVGDNGAQYAVQEFLGSGRYGDQTLKKGNELTKIQPPADAKMAAEGKLTRGQKSAGQVGSTEVAKSTGPILGKPEKKHPFQGRLVGANESVEVAEDDVEEAVVGYFNVTKSKFKPGMRVEHQFFPNGGVVVRWQGNNVLVKVEHDGKERFYSVPPTQLTVANDTNDDLSDIVRLSKPNQ